MVKYFPVEALVKEFGDDICPKIAAHATAHNMTQNAAANHIRAEWDKFQSATKGTIMGVDLADNLIFRAVLDASIEAEISKYDFDRVIIALNMLISVGGASVDEIEEKVKRGLDTTIHVIAAAFDITEDDLKAELAARSFDPDRMTQLIETKVGPNG